MGAFGSVNGPVVGDWKIFLAKLFQLSSTSGFSQVRTRAPFTQQPQNSHVLRHNNKIRSRFTIPTSHDTRIKISLVARPLLTSPAQKLCRYERDTLSARRRVSCCKGAAAAAVRILTEVWSHAVTRALDTGISWHKQQFDDSQPIKTLFVFWPLGSEQLRHTADRFSQPPVLSILGSRQFNINGQYDCLAFITRPHLHAEERLCNMGSEYKVAVLARSLVGFLVFTCVSSSPRTKHKARLLNDKKENVHEEE